MKQILLMCFAVLAFTSCSQDEVKEVRSPESISFRTPGFTKAAEIESSSDLKELGFYVSAYLENAVSADSDRAGQEPTYSFYFNNEHYFWSLESYVSETAYYWPSDGSNLKFYAFTPASTEFEVSAPADGQDGILLLEGFSPALSISEQDDFIVAEKTTNKADTGNEGGVVLEFSHALSQIRINAKNTHSRYVVNIKGVRLGNISTGATYRFGDDAQRWQWPDSRNHADYTLTYETPVSVNSDNAALMPDNESAMLIPQQLTAWDPTQPEAGGAYIGVLINIKTKADDNSAEAAQAYPATKDAYDWVAIPISTYWEEGKRYTYTLDFSDGAGYVAPTKTDENAIAGTRIGNDIKFSVTVDDFEEETIVKRNDPRIIGTWKAYKYVDVNYNNDGEESSRNEGDLTQHTEGTEEYEETLEDLKNYVEDLYYFRIADIDEKFILLNDDGTESGRDAQFRYVPTADGLGYFEIPTIRAKAYVQEISDIGATIYLDYRELGNNREQWYYYTIEH